MNHGFAGVVGRYVSGEDDPGSFFKRSRKVRHLPLKPLGGQDAGIVADGDFQDSSPAVISKLRLRDGGDNRLNFISFQFVDFADFPAIFIGPGQKIKQIFNRPDFFCGKPLSHFRPYAFQKLHRQGQFFNGGFQILYSGGNLLFLRRPSRIKRISGVFQPFQDERGFRDFYFLSRHILQVVIQENTHHIVQGGSKNIFCAGRNGGYLESNQTGKRFPQIFDVRQVFKVIFCGEVQRLFDSLQIFFKRLHFILRKRDDSRYDFPEIIRFFNK